MMKEFIINFLKSILHDPLLAIVFFVAMISGAMWIFILSRSEKTAELVEKSSICFFLFLACGIWISPFMQLNPGRLTIIDRSIFAQISQLALYGLISFVLWPKFCIAIKKIEFALEDRFLWILLIFAAASTLWSIDPPVTLRASLMLLFLTFFAVLLAVNYNFQEISGFFRVALTIVLCGSMLIRHTTIGIFDFEDPWGGPTGPKGISGIAGHANALGPMMALNAVLWLDWLFRGGKHRWFAVVPIFLSTVLLVLSNSVGTWVGFLVTILIFIALNVLRRVEHKLFLILVMLSAWLTVGLLALMMNNLELIMNFFGRDLTFTGRTGIWIVLWERLIRPHLFFGNGYAGFFQAGRYVGTHTRFIARYIGPFALGHAHNGFMQLLVDLGFVGLILFILSLLRNIIKAVKQFYYKRSAESVLLISLLIFFVSISMAENNILTLNIYWILYVAISVCLTIEAQDTDVK